MLGSFPLWGIAVGLVISGEYLAGVAALSAEERMVARMTLAAVPLKTFLQDLLIPYEQDEVTRLIVDSHDKDAFEPISHLTVGDFRNWLLSDTTRSELLARVAPGITPEMAAAVSKLMRDQDLILTAKKCRVVTRFRNTIGLPGHLSVRLQPNHPTDDLKGIAASMLDGLLYGSGDAVIGINPASDSLPLLEPMNYMLDDVIHRFKIPTPTCVLTHVTNTLKLLERGAPVDVVFQSRVALGDDIGECLRAKAVAILIGERPGLSSPDSLSIYLTWGPHTRRLESERNCISNIRPEGLDYPEAAFKWAWLLEQAFHRRLSGVALKDESDNPAMHGKIHPPDVGHLTTP